jgi:putative hemolysin
MQSYLRAGAWVEGAPAYDRAFRCADLLTVLDTERMSPRYAARFMKEGED